MFLKTVAGALRVDKKCVYKRETREGTRGGI